MTTDLAAFAKEKGVKYFMVSFTDLFGAQRAKLVPTQAIADMQEEGAGFAGFASWLDMTPAHADMLAVPDPSSVIQLPWKREVAWVAANVMEGAGGAGPSVLNACLPAPRPTACASKPGWRPNSSC